MLSTWLARGDFQSDPFRHPCRYRESKNVRRKKMSVCIDHSRISNSQVQGRDGNMSFGFSQDVPSFIIWAMLFVF